MITEINNSVIDSPPVQELIPGLDRGNSDSPESRAAGLIPTFYCSSVFSVACFLPPLAYLSSPASGEVIPPPGEFYFKLGLYGVTALAALVGFICCC